MHVNYFKEAQFFNFNVESSAKLYVFAVSHYPLAYTIVKVGQEWSVSLDTALHRRMLQWDLLVQYGNKYHYGAQHSLQRT